MIIQHVQVGFIPCILGWFYIRKPIYVNKHITRLKDKNLNREFDKIQYLFMILKKKVNKLGMGKNLFNLT